MLSLLILRQCKEQESLKKRQMREFSDILANSQLTVEERECLQEMEKTLFPTSNNDTAHACSQKLSERLNKLPKVKLTEEQLISVMCSS